MKGRPPHFKPKRGQWFRAYQILASGRRHYHAAGPFRCLAKPDRTDRLEVGSWKFDCSVWRFELIDKPQPTTNNQQPATLSKLSRKESV